MPSGGLLAQIVLTMGGGGVVATVIQSVMSRRLTRAEAQRTYAEGGRAAAESEGAMATAARTSVDTAVALLTPMREEMGRLTARVTELEAEVRAGRGRERAGEVLLQAYIDWAGRAADALDAHGIPIDPPPAAAGRDASPTPEGA